MEKEIAPVLLKINKEHGYILYYSCFFRSANRKVPCISKIFLRLTMGRMFPSIAVKTFKISTLERNKSFRTFFDQKKETLSVTGFQHDRSPEKFRIYQGYKVRFLDISNLHKKNFPAILEYETPS